METWTEPCPTCGRHIEKHFGSERCTHCAYQEPGVAEAVMAAKRQEEARYIGHKTRSGFTTPGIHQRDKAKAKAAKAARKRNRA
jgi:hypothetical protein